MSKSVCDIKFYGFDELAKSLDVADNVLKKAIEDCMKKSAELPKRDMLDFMSKHKLTGVTERSFKDLDITWKGNVCTGAIKIEKALMKATRRDGTIDFAQGDTKGIGSYSQIFDRMPFAQGMGLYLSKTLDIYEKTIG